MQFIFVEGAITKNGITTRTSSKNGTSFSTFTVRVDSGSGKFKRKDFFDCVCYGKGGENIAKYFQPHDLIQIRGEMQNNPWKKNEKGFDAPNWQLIVSDWAFPPVNESKTKSENADSEPDFATTADEFTLVDDGSSELPF